MDRGIVTGCCWRAIDRKLGHARANAEARRHLPGAATLGVARQDLVM